jgi:hypothetical protein
VVTTKTALGTCGLDAILNVQDRDSRVQRRVRDHLEHALGLGSLHARLILPGKGVATWVEGKGNQRQDEADPAKSKTD